MGGSSIGTLGTVMRDEARREMAGETEKHRTNYDGIRNPDAPSESNKHPNPFFEDEIFNRMDLFDKA
jgi:hypothetical protein